MKEGIQGRRSETRFRWWSPCNLNIEGLYPARAYALDVSLSGMSMIGRFEAPPGSILELEVSMFPSEGPICMMGSVAWCVNQGDYSVIGTKLREKDICQLSWIRLINNARLITAIYPRAS